MLNKYVIYPTTIVLLLLVLVLAYLLKATSDKTDVLTELVSSKLSTTTDLDRDGMVEIVQQQLEVSNLRMLKKIGILEGNQEKLKEHILGNRKLLKDGGSGTYVEGETHVYNTVETVVKGDTLPVYYGKYSDSVLTWSVIARKDSTELDFRYKPSYIFVLGTKRKKGPFSQKVPVISAESQDKYTAVTKIESIAVKGKLPRFALGTYVGVGATMYNQQLIVGPQVGVGATYTLFNL